MCVWWWWWWWWGGGGGGGGEKVRKKRKREKEGVEVFFPSAPVRLRLVVEIKDNEAPVVAG